MDVEPIFGHIVKAAIPNLNISTVPNQIEGKIIPTEGAIAYMKNILIGKFSKGVDGLGHVFQMEIFNS